MKCYCKQLYNTTIIAQCETLVIYKRVRMNNMISWRLRESVQLKIVRKYYDYWE